MSYQEHEVSEKRESSFKPSPLEDAFDTMAQTFGSELLPPYLNKHDQVVRLSIPVEVNNTIVAFEYRRLNPLTEYGGDVSKMLLALNPSLRETIGKFKQTRNPSMTDLLKEARHEDTIIEAVENRVIVRDGTLDPIKALSDPTYFSEESPLLRWPERFEVALFNSGRETIIPLQPIELGRKGKLDSVRPDVWLFLKTSLQYHPNWDAGGSELVIRHPQREYETLIAFNRAFSERPEEFPDRHGIDIDDIGWFADSQPWTQPVFPTQYSPEKIMEEVGTFVRELTR